MPLLNEPGAGADPQIGPVKVRALAAEDANGVDNRLLARNAESGDQDGRHLPPERRRGTQIEGCMKKYRIEQNDSARSRRAALAPPPALARLTLLQ